MSEVIPSIDAMLFQLQALSSFIDQGGDNATFVFYCDEKPSSTNIAADTNKELVTLTLPKPSLKQILSDGVELHPTATSLAIRSGRAIWARLYNGDKQVVMDFEIGLDIVLNNNNIVEGGTQILDSIIFNIVIGGI